MSHVAREDIAEIVRLGTLRSPREACGLLLTRHDAGPRIVEVPNRASDPTHDVIMDGPDLQMALAELIGGHPYEGNLQADLVLWHTHPSGNVGPSRTDMKMKRQLGDIRCLVVSLPGGEAAQF